MAEFEAKITGIADLSKAKQDFDSFKKSMEQPIKITVDASGFNAVWGNLQKQVQSFGAQAGRQYTQGFEKNIASIDTSKVANAMLKGIDNKITAKMGKGSLSLSIFGDSGLKELGASPAIFKTLEKELDSIKQKGLQIQSIKFNEDGTSFIAKAINDMGTLVTLTSRWKQAVAQTDKDGNFLGVNGGEWQTNIQYLTNFTSGAKQAQAEAKKLSSELDKVSQSFITGTFDANISKMEQGLMGISNSVSSDLVKKASDAAAEYYRITQEISNSLANPNQQGALQGQQLADAYKQAEVSLKTYNNSMTEVRANTQKMLAEGVGARNANQVETWAKNNSKALKQYGDQLTDLANKMRNAQTQGELNGYVNQFKNLKAEITAAGLGGRSFGDQLKNAFVHIGEFTGIYAITSQIRQLPREMAQEVIKIDTAMTELRKVSTASASEISDYFDRATDSAYKYGQAINEVIDSTASWTRLGYNLEDSEKLTNASIALSRVGSGMDVESSTSAIQSTIKGFGMAADEAQHVADLVNYIADTEPIDARGIGEGLTRFSSAMSMAGNSLEESIGLLTASTAVTQDPAKSANDWRTISMRIRGAKTELEAMGEDTTGMVTSVSKIREEFKALSGVDIMQDENTFKSTTQIVLELADAWEHMTDIQRASLGELAGGKRGAQSLFAAVQNADIIRKTIADANGDAVGSVDRQMAVWESSIDASLQRFHVAFQELSTDVINSDFIKGAVDTGTTIIKIIDELVEHIGVLGTALTGLGIAKIFTTAVNGAKSVEVASDGVELLATALEAAQGSGAGLTGTIKGLSGVLGTLGAKAGGAGSALGGLFSNLGGFLMSPAGLITAGVAAVAGITAYVIKRRKEQEAELRKQATATTEKWTGDKSSIDEYKSQYTQLNEQLKNANLTESERIGIKQQLLDLQTQISEKYGSDVGQLDLINGKYETQLSLISQIAEKEAHRNLQDNREAYQQAVNEMTKDRTYTMSSNGSESNLMKQVEWAYIQSGFKDQGDLTFEFTGDVSEADESIRELMDRLEALKETASETEKQFLDNVIGSASKLLAKNKEILDANQANYKAYLEQSLYDDGFGDELAEYSKRTQEYNDALLSGDTERIVAARKELNDYKGTVKEITDAHAEYGDFFDEVANSVLKTSEAVFDFKDIMDDGIADSSNSLSEYSDQIFRTVNEIKKLGLDGVDIQAILGNPKSAMYGDLSQLAKLWNPDIDLTKESDLKSVADFLMQMAYGADAVSGSVDLARSEFDDFMKSASASIDTLDKVNASLVNSFKSGGLSARIDAETGELTGDVATILNAYKKELGDGNIDDLFERTADGIIVNRDALRALQAQQENTTKAEFIERIKEAEAHLANASTDEERQAWQTRLDNVKLLASAYDGATSAYQKWLDAQKMGEAGDQYDTIASTAIKRGEELYNKGLVGTNEFRAIAQLYSDEDLALASIDEITEAYENGVDTVKKYFTEGQEGAVAFADKLVELGAATKEGDFYNFEDGINTAEIADELDISVDLVEAAFKKLGDYGFNIHFMNEDQIAEFDSLTEKAEEAQEKLKELRDSGAEVGDTDLIDIDLSEIDTVDEMKSALDQLNEVVASPDIDPESAEAYQAIIDSLQQKLDLLSQTDIGNEVNFTNLDNAYTLLGSLQGRIDSINGINATSSIDIDVTGDDEVQLVAEQIANLPPDIKTAIGFDVEDDATAVIEKLQSEKVQIPVEYQQPTNTPNATGTATVSVQYEQGDLPSVSSQTVHLDYEPNPLEANVVAKLDNTAVESYNPVSKDADVVYGVDSSAPDGYQPSGKYATVTYDVSVNGASAVYNLPDSGSRTITYHIETVGSPPGNYKGTVPRSAFQGMAHVRGTAHASGLSKYGLKQNENSLINELGAEIVVRPSEDSWMIFNDGMPTFASLRKDDIIFNADQTKELLEKGWTKNYASILGGAFASGTVKGSAHARKVTGSGSFKKAKSSSSGGGGRNGGGGGGSDGGGSSESKEDAKEFNEILDEIQINIDRIERDIKNLDTIASDTFTNLTGRTSALNRELVKVRKEIKVQQTGYSRYLAKANSVGLNGDWAARVRNGENLTIDDVGDEELWDKISEYKKWWNSRHSIHLTAGKLRRHINYNARMKYA